MFLPGILYNKVDVSCYSFWQLLSMGTGIRGLMRGIATLPKVTRSY